MPRPLDEKVDPRRAALVVVDVQNDYCHSDGASAKRGGDRAPIQAMVPRLGTLIDEARVTGVPVVWIRTENNEHTISEALKDLRSDVPDEHRYSCLSGSWGAEYYLVEPLPGEPVITKHRYSAFVNTDLDLILRSRGIRTLIMTGVATNVCVESTARDGFMHDYEIVMVDDCCATSKREDHEATLRNMTRFFGVVTTADEVLHAWQSALEPAKRSARGWSSGH